jgi:hypothetical protein
MTPAQCRAARALLDISIDQLHGSSVVPRVIIEAFEAGGAKLRQADLDAIQGALEVAGVEFIEGGVKLRKEGK